jgi:hypothetical protein
VLTLHQAIELVLRGTPRRAATSTAIATEINARGLYVRPSDGGPVSASQVAARARTKNYRQLFETDGAVIRLRR